MSNVNPYPLSTDYQKLLAHLKKGEIVVAFVNFSFFDHKHVFRDVCQVKMVNGAISCSVRGTGYLDLSEFDVALHNSKYPESKIDLDGLFMLACKNMELGWIEPSNTDGE